MPKSNDSLGKNKKYDKRVFIIPLAVSIAGLIICLIGAGLSRDVNKIALIGFIIISLGTIMALNALINEKYRLGLRIGFPLKMIFPAYPVVEDFDALTEDTSTFRTAYSEFMDNKGGARGNSRLQNHATQILWHCLHLQKKRMEKLGVQMELDANRRAYSKDSNGIRSSAYFDGRYNVNDVYEEIYATRTFRHGEYTKKLYNKQVAHYTFLSAKNAGNGEIICPNCGKPSTRSNLIDGCDFCQTKFTIEDLDNRIADFGFRRDFHASEGKRKAVKKLILPWIYMFAIIPMMYMGLFFPFLYGQSINLLVRIGLGLFCALGLGFAGFALCSFAMFFIAPLVFIGNQCWGVLNDKIIYRSNEEQEKKIAGEVRKKDALFSLQSFFGGVQNKLYAIHFADSKNQINAFSDCDLSKHLQKYEKVLDIDTLSLSMTSYINKNGKQIADVSADLLLRELNGNRLKKKKELLKIRLEKNGDCKTQAICAPSILKCKSCGSNLSLMEGKKCSFCGTELNMKEHDWVITEYSSSIVK